MTTRITTSSESRKRRTSTRGIGRSSWGRWTMEGAVARNESRRKRRSRLILLLESSGTFLLSQIIVTESPLSWILSHTRIRLLDDRDTIAPICHQPQLKIGSKPLTSDATPLNAPLCQKRPQIPSSNQVSISKLRGNLTCKVQTKTTWLWTFPHQGVSNHSHLGIKLCWHPSLGEDHQLGLKNIAEVIATCADHTARVHHQGITNAQKSSKVMQWLSET